MGYSAIKQHSERKGHIEFSSQLPKGDVPTSSNVTCKQVSNQMDNRTEKDEVKHTQKVLQEFLIKTSHSSFENAK